MGAVNYFTSDYITLGYDLSVDYNEEDFNSVDELEECCRYDMEDSYEEIKSILEKYSFYFYHVVIKPGYYEGFTVDIENNFSLCFDDYREKQEAQKEITEIKQFLLECAAAGLVAVFPGWCTGYKNTPETIQLINEAVKEMRNEAKHTPTYKNYVAQ